MNTRTDLADKTVTVTTALPLFNQADTTVQYRIEGYWKDIAGTSWMFATGNPACLSYAMRAGLSGLPVDDDVLYGKTPDGLGHLVHVSEITEGNDDTSPDQP